LCFSEEKKNKNNKNKTKQNKTKHDRCFFLLPVSVTHDGKRRRRKKTTPQAMYLTEK